MPANSVFQDWLSDLTFQQQSVLVLALRGPDGIAKYHPCKGVQRAYRATVLKAASTHAPMKLGDKGDGFMQMPNNPPSSEVVNSLLFGTGGLPAWGKMMRDFFSHIDELPHHFINHLIHGAEIIGYKHPDPVIRGLWYDFYLKAVDDAHLMPESEAQMDERLKDFGWYEQQDLAGSA